MTRTQTTIGLLAMATVAFVAGRLSTAVPSAAAMASPQSKSDPLKDVADSVKSSAKKLGDAVAGKQDQPPADMQAWIKAGTPGKHHEYLEPGAGTFDAVVRFRMNPNDQWVESKGVVTREWVLGKRFLRETVKSESPMGTYNAIGYLGYNNYDGQYEFAWMEDMSSAIYMQYGTYDAEKKVMTLRSSHRDPATGKLMIGQGTWDMSNPDRQAVEGTMIGPDGKPFKSFEGVFERKK